jgi:glycosyltransferase involved in cell wall biosynthesis
VPKTNSSSAQSGLSPLKLYESMASGVPVIASDLPGLGDAVRAHDCGLTFAPGDAAGLARCVAEIAADPVRARRMGANGRAAAVALYSWDARAGQTEDVLLGLVSRGAAGRGPGSPQHPMASAG